MVFSCVIPFYNEKTRVVEVIKVVSNLKELSEIIVIDDGSGDNSSRFIKEKFPQIKLITHHYNKGKSSAILSGAKLAKEENLLLLDSDLTGLLEKEISQAMKIFITNKLDCLLLSTKPRSIYDSITRKLFKVPFSMAGNRIIKKEILFEVFKNKFPKGYQLEISTNNYLMKNNKKVSFFDISAINIGKRDKDGLIRGTIKEFKMWRQIISFNGWFFFIKQTCFFSKIKSKKNNFSLHYWV